MGATVQHAKQLTIADWTGTVTVGNSSGGTLTMMATDLVRPSDHNSAHNLTIDLVGSELPNMSFYEPWPLHNTNSTVTAPGIGTWYLQPLFLPFKISSGQFAHFITASAPFKNGTTYSAATTGSMSKQATQNFQIAIYERGTGANSTRLESQWSKEISILATQSLTLNATTTSNLTVSNAATISFPAQYDASGGVTYSTSSVSGSTSVGASTGASTLADNLLTGLGAYISGAMQVYFPLDSNIPAGDYWLAWMNSSNVSTSGTRYTAGTVLQAHSRVGLLDFNLSQYRRFGKSTTDSSGFGNNGIGFFATTSTSPPGTIATSDLRESTGRVYMQYERTNW